MPVPFRVSGSALVRVKPLRSSTAPEATEVPTPVVPRGPSPTLPAAPSWSVPALMVVPPVYVLFPERFKIPAPAFIIANAPLITDVTDKSGFNPPLATVNVRAAPPSARGALIAAVVALAIELTFPARVIVPVPVIEVPVMLTDPTVVTLLAAIAKMPLLTVSAFVMAMVEARVTVLFAAPPVLATVRLATVAGRPFPTA